MHKNKIIELSGVSKYFIDQDRKVEILDNVDLEIFEGEKVAIIGPSGSGKSTILSLISGLDTPHKGNILVKDKIVNKLVEKDISLFRNQEIGIVFQSFELILPFSVYENVSAPQDISGKINKNKIDELIKEVGLNHKKHSSVTNLSGGEKQRVAIARALSNSPNIILADEPTGSLDRITGKHILDLFIDLVKNENKTLVLVTHDEEVAKKMDKVFLLKDKKLVEVKY